MSVDEELPTFPFPPGTGLAPTAEYARRRRECPFGRVRLPSGDSAILLVRYADVAAAVSESRLSRNHVMPGAARNSGESNFLYDPVLIMNQLDDLHHSIHRVTTQALKPRRVEDYLPVIEKIAQGLAADVLRRDPPVDLVDEFTDRLGLLTIAKLLGVPRHDCPRIRQWTAAYTLSTPTPTAERDRVVDEFAEYVQRLTANPRAVPDSPLLQDLAFQPDGSAALSHHDLASIVKLLLSAAGTEAPSVVLGRSMLFFLRDGARHWHQVVRAPETAALVTEEMIRLVHAGDTGALRTALTDVRLPSGTVPAGQAVLVAWISALHDPDHYENPEEFLLEREGRNVAFGGGRNFCPGVHLAKAVLTVAVRTLAERFPNLRLAVPDDAVTIEDTPLGGIVRSLPVTW